MNFQYLSTLVLNDNRFALRIRASGTFGANNGATLRPPARSRRGSRSAARRDGRWAVHPRRSVRVRLGVGKGDLHRVELLSEREDECW